MWMNHPRLLCFKSPWLLSLLVPMAITCSHTFLHNFKRSHTQLSFLTVSNYKQGRNSNTGFVANFSGFSEMKTVKNALVPSCSLAGHLYFTENPGNPFHLKPDCVSVKHYPWPSHSASFRRGCYINTSSHQIPSTRAFERKQLLANTDVANLSWYCV